jgi:uncharacterized membrane protein YgdD (TMEM256/DUF423 family)
MSRPTEFPGNRYLAAGGFSGFFAIALGAFGAHALKNNLTEQQQEIYRTAAHYQIVHALALLALGLWCNQQNQKMAVAGWSWIIGSLLFSGSLYALAVSDIKILGAITPFGGILLMLGWIVFAFRAWKA